jgi:hypothetical protein
MQEKSMNRICKPASLVSFLALLSAGAAITQTPSGETSLEAKAAAPVAYVYVQTTEGVNLYDAATNGKLTLVSGSPFKTTGAMVGSNGKYFITLGKKFIYSYLIAANGAIGEQVSTINSQDYAGGTCGATNGAILDHTGHSLYVGIWNRIADSSGACSALQSFAIAKDSGALSFVDDADNGDQDTFTLPTLSSSDTFGYSVDADSQNPLSLIGFKRAANGGLNAWGFKETDPKPEQGEGSGWGYYPWIANATPGDYLAAVVFEQQDAPDGEFSPFQLASYTLDSKGDLTSTNRSKDMPTPTVCPTSLNMSHGGNLLAVAGRLEGCGDGLYGSAGLQIFHFNGPAPITAFGKAISTVSIGQIHWDGSNHLYALSDSTNKLYVYTITPTSIAESPGSPYTIASPSSLVVVTK